MATMKQPEPMGAGNGARGVVDKARDAATDVASTAKNVAREQVSGRVNETKERAVSGLGDVAGALRRTGEEADNDMLQDYVARAADGIEHVTEYFRTKHPGEIVRDVERFARREPALFIGGAFALGLLGARFLKSSSRAQIDDEDFAAPLPPMPRAPMHTAPLPRASMRETPRPLAPIGLQPTGVQTSAAVEPPPLVPRPESTEPQQHAGIVDPLKPRGGEGSGTL